ncbi:MAG: hypothetical protein DA328_03315 [Nitrososphaeraceae archaeon]|nr:hypothetical protein [Nitrososphaeraceae archaeon]
MIKVILVPIRYNNIDFKSIVKKYQKIKKFSAVVTDKESDSEENHVLVSDKLRVYKIIYARQERVPVWEIHSRYRKKIKYGDGKLLYNQRIRDEFILAVIKKDCLGSTSHHS